MRILITGAGSLAKVLAQRLISEENEWVALFCNDEFQLAEAEAELLAPGESVRKREVARFFLGDIRDYRRVCKAARTADVVLHTAAIKRIETAEQNPEEAVDVNIRGTQVVMEACAASGVERAVFISTDKACLPISLYGTTKAAAEKLWIGGNSYYQTEFNVARFGNFVGSRGSVLPMWRKRLESGFTALPITDPRMTRFWTTLDSAADLTIKACTGKSRGVIYIPKSPSFLLTDLADVLGGKRMYVGMRQGERLHEIMSHEYEVVADKGSHFVIYPDGKSAMKKAGPHTSEKVTLSQDDIRSLLAGVRVPEAAAPTKYRSDA